MATVKLEKIYKSFGETEVLFDINLEINDKEFVVFVGPSGCGKTTLLRIISGLEEATSGSVIIRDKDVSNDPPVERGISMVFQSYALYPHLSVFENIAFPLTVAKVNEKELEEKVFKAADILQLRDRLDFKPGQLSGGKRQRVAIGRSIVRDPKVFLFDEPLSNLDALLRIKMRLEIKKLQRKMGVTSIFVTHDQVEAMTLADRLAVINNGIIEQLGTPIEIYNNPQSLFVAGFIGSPQMNFIDGELKNNTILTDSFTIPNFLSDFNGDVIVGIRPEHISPSKKGEINITIDLVEQLGSDNIIYGDLIGGKEFCYRSPGNIVANLGDKLSLSIVENKFHVFDKKTSKILN
jgi:ABC-type sugar transport system ATPase subunit